MTVRPKELLKRNTNPLITAPSPDERFHSFVDDCRARVDLWLNNCLPPSSDSLHEALRYTVLGGGKRIRAILTYATADALGDIIEDTDRAACAVELIHAYSLIHDDLPAMDNDDLRRGKPTCHIAFGEAMAILAGDALQALAFEQLASMRLIPAEMVVRAVGVLARAAGSKGMICGQAMDLAAAQHDIPPDTLETMHQRKTGAMISASVQLGAITAQCMDDHILTALNQYSDAIGLAFQIQDDLLDDSGETAVLGKRQGADRNLSKATYPSILGSAGARAKLVELQQQSHAALASLGASAAHLHGIANYIVARDH